ncbi:MAG: hypothetical protein A3I61_01455 [Acidobacteria bacterium RIFCSPLOWO2_02_FULL_68_18]|nr:MAG: hypothetical protein A3I61_01455 [Acidobacteria bacterium RIFCSPLOWO2_02_FULL_68_18]OFW51580.1 MAG: hypothetical protein A3G77_18850 [Acidobacteria bacterium RIFCSPLOWO2_12_FULL_68_19]
MIPLAQALVGLSGVAFVLAVITNFGVESLSFTSSEGYSRAAANLALIALALVLCFRNGARTR